MRRVLVLVVAAIAAAALTVPLTASGAKPKRIHFSFTSKLVGGQISATDAAYRIKDSRFGKGAGVQTVKLDGLKGTDTDTTYYRHGSADSHGTFTVGTPDADGIATITGKGKDTGGTGVAKGFKSTYTVNGTVDTKTLRFEVTLKGKGSLPAPKKKHQ